MDRVARAWVRVGVALCTLAAAACASRSARPEAGAALDLGRYTGGEQRVCHTSAEVAELDASALLRPGARGTLVLLAPGHGPADSLSLSVRYGDDGLLAWVLPLRGTLPAPTVEAFARAVREGLQPRARPDWGVRLVLVGGDVAAIRPSIQCPPRPRRSVRRYVPPPRGTQALRAWQRLEGLQVEFLLTIDVDGRVIHARLPESTGDRSLDQYLIAWAMETEFAPKLHDGVAVASTLPAAIRIPRTGRRRR